MKIQEVHGATQKLASIFLLRQIRTFVTDFTSDIAEMYLKFKF